MKAEELRIGNWYTDGFGKYDQITPQDIQELADDPQDDFYQPISLTLVVLYDCGFEVYHENPRLEIFYINKQGYYPFFIYQSRDLRIWFNENLELKYLHQLQNLFLPLTGNELTVNLNELIQNIIENP